MLIKKHIAAVTALLVVCSTPLAAFADGTLLTLGDAVAKAQQAAPRLQGADAALRVAEANVQMSGLLPNPTLSVEAENVMGSGRYAGFGGGEKTVSVSVPLELGGKRQARVRVAQAERAVLSR
jgi:cobalt-zinc-cadmium efflux system outer membrane protein